ncbi:hypothetical protein H112_05479 [Trichophyton rubrum D6]|uniref:Major facilitator superfamily (MFS) profile domain-containing protein n=3 Tax=Trichophyton TaxID=5550 RepID=F2SJK9_TRIRC|nr:uncharacterized protein TERG_03216 [Trichophyton rubrum CBS 118892]EZF17200.1 hypothetical protein H100_05496 [Trichophyton rubrum MR850]EZF40609.1 hypothetical protein H102_05462 [Trichophyton rubrum CBS 100081]EZF51278.1 hypothetical protein H103_05489 [Trichophyton rubrum CBS 288.86]EZF61803.1 hypothetical protein H104_05478 [Trichophyton rubrum CBS 289.86]EZF72461.1 hypothetical protein H105_05505 [Trichophyton soudanense CBS 452.61]EZF83169.1 hypothetical protein H110_05485 [Trichophy
MRLTRQARHHNSSPPTSSRADDAFPTVQLFILAVCRFAEPIALTSIFPYSWVMVKDFNIGDKSNASFYAGIIISAFALSESLTGMFWGGLSDKVGRKPVLLLGCAGTVLSLMIVGFSRNFWMALLGRVVGGLLNGNVGVIQTMVGEVVKNPDHEPRAYAVMPFVWSIGTIIGPAIGGTFAQPYKSFPSLFSPSGLFGTFPYLLPNIICSLLLFISIFAGYFFLNETHPDHQPQHTRIEGAEQHTDEDDNDTIGAPLYAVATAGSTAHAGADLTAKSYGTFNEVDMHEDEEWYVRPDGKSLPAPDSGKVFTKRVTMLIIALGIFTYHSMTYDHLLPIFLQDQRDGLIHHRPSSPLDIPGGLALSTQTVGLIMAVNGVIALIIQAFIFPIVTEWLGVWSVFVLVTILHPVAYFIVPFLVFLPIRLLYPGIYTCLTIRNLFSILAYPVLLILIKQASPSYNTLGKINGLAASAGAACRTLAPPIAGYLYTVGTRIGFTGIAWWASSLVAIFGALQLWFMSGKPHTSVSILARPPCFSRHVETHPPVIHVHVEEEEQPTPHERQPLV